MSRDDVLDFSPPLADQLAIVIDLAFMDEVAAEILRVVRPDRHAQLRRLLLSKQLTGSLSKVKTNRPWLHSTFEVPEDAPIPNQSNQARILVFDARDLRRGRGCFP